MINLKAVIKELEKYSNPKNVAGEIRFGIVTKDKQLGVDSPHKRKIAKMIGKNHELALQLWDTKIYDARIVAGFIEEPKKVTEKQMEEWVKDFDNWGLCDSICMHLFDRVPLAYKKCFEWAERREEFVRRAGFALMAVLAVHDKVRKDKDFIKFFPLIKKYSIDERNFVRKAVNWALRQIGKRNANLCCQAIKLAKEIKKINSKSARWIVSDALRELENYSF